jgi:Mitochondrial carrier protein
VDRRHGLRTRLAWSLEAQGSGTILGSMRAIVEQDGVRGLYQGMRPTLIGILPYSGIKFYTYQYLKRRWRDAAPPTGAALPIHVTLMSGGAAGLLAQTLTYPLDVVRRRMQVSGARTQAAIAMPHSMWGHVKHIVASHGVVGLFRGVSLNYIKVRADGLSWR